MLRRPPRSTLFPTRRSSDLLDGRSTVTRADTLHSLRRPTWPSRCTLVFERRIVISPLKRRRSSTTETARSEEHTSELQSLTNLVCRLLLEKKKKKTDS